MIEFNHVTKSYGPKRGVFDLNLKIEQGTCFGFLGPNGSGKTTTIRLLMGFVKPTLGQALINGLNTWEFASQIQHQIGYLSAEINLFKETNGLEFLKRIAELKGVKDLSYMDYLIDYFDAKGSLYTPKLSVGEKRKLGIIAAFLSDPMIYLLDEPTTGLDPIIQRRFIDFIQMSKKRQKTILLSSHMFAEIEALSDRVAMIKEGCILADFWLDDLRHLGEKTYQITLQKRGEFNAFTKHQYQYLKIDRSNLTVVIKIHHQQINRLIHQLASLSITSFKEDVYSLEDHFMQFYLKEDSDEQDCD